MSWIVILNDNFNNKILSSINHRKLMNSKFGIEFIINLIILILVELIITTLVLLYYY